MPKSPNVGPKPVDNGMIGGPYKPAGIGGSSPVQTISESGAKGAGLGLQGLASGSSYPQSWVDTYNRQSPGTQSAMASRWSGMSPDAITSDWNTNIQPGYAPGTSVDQILGGASMAGTQQGMGWGLPPGATGLGGSGIGGVTRSVPLDLDGGAPGAPGPAAPAPRAGFQQGNRGAAKRMGGQLLGGVTQSAPSAGGNPWAPTTAVSNTGSITGDPRPGTGAGPEAANWGGGGGLQSLLTRGRQSSPWAKGF